MGLFFAGDFHHAFGNQRSRNTGAEIILIFIDRPGLHHGVNEIRSEFLLQIVNEHLGGTRALGLFIQTPQLLLLPHVGAKSDHFGVVFFLQPRKQHRSV